MCVAVYLELKLIRYRNFYKPRLIVSALSKIRSRVNSHATFADMFESLEFGNDGSINEYNMSVPDTLLPFDGRTNE